MHLRRALLLFAIVLGFAAVAASLTPVPDEPEREGQPEEPPSATRIPSPPPPGAQRERAGEPKELRFDTRGTGTEREEIDTGTHAVVVVESREPGQVEIEGLGLLGFAEAGAPARFDILPADPGRYEIRFSPVEGTPRPVGVLQVTAAPA